MLGQLTDRPDRPAYVRFETIAKEDKAASTRAGTYIGRDVDMALITPPYSKDVFKQQVDKWFPQLDVDAQQGRIPKEWVDKYKEAYRAWKNGQDIPLDGTPIKGWLRVSPAQQEAMISAGVRTVEDLAAANDEALRRIGMGAVELKNIAQAEIKASKDIGPVVRENAALKQSVSLLEGSVENLTKQVEQLTRMVQNQQPPQAVQEITANDIIEDEPQVRAGPALRKK